jgi:predicted ATP-dependent endonuclease of OLD family
MAPFIKSVTPSSLLNGAFPTRIEFRPGLNIISGENGTGKTKLLGLLQPPRGPGHPAPTSQHQVEVEDGAFGSLKVQAISPKRNAERKNFLSALQEMHRNDKTLDKYLSQIQQHIMADDTFTTYPSISEHFYYEYEALCRDGGNQIEKMQEAAKKLNAIIQSILESLELCAEWENGHPKLSIRKSGNEFPINALSCGEKEILALILNLYLSREKFDVFLIDEPEIHLNWHLEEELFKYLKSFCSKYQKQVILATHSRVVFKPDFLGHVQFLYWNDGKITCSKDISEEMRRRIAGDAIEIIKLGNFGKPTFFVEDKIHELVIRSIAEKENVDISISAVGNSSIVKSLFRLSKDEDTWSSCYFVIDGDNQGNPYPTESNFVHLDKYCMENYLLDFQVCASISHKTTHDICSAILKAIKDNQSAILGRNRFFEFLVDMLNETHITEESLAHLDASQIFHQFTRDVGFDDEERFVTAYVAQCYAVSRLDVLPKRLVQIIQEQARS